MVGDSLYMGTGRPEGSQQPLAPGRIQAQGLSPEGAYPCLGVCIGTMEQPPGAVRSVRSCGQLGQAPGLRLASPSAVCTSFLSSLNAFLHRVLMPHDMDSAPDRVLTDASSSADAPARLPRLFRCLGREAELLFVGLV